VLGVSKGWAYHHLLVPVPESVLSRPRLAVLELRQRLWRQRTLEAAYTVENTNTAWKVSKSPTLAHYVYRCI